MSYLKIPGCVLFLMLALPVSIPAQTNVPATSSAPPTAPAAPAPPPVPPGIVFTPDVVIGKGGNTDLHADIAYPKNATRPTPAIIYIHGGGWTKGTYKKSPILPLAEAGYFAASIEYRLSPAAKWPAQIQDCKLAVRWVRANAATYNVDPDHIGSWGDSAGGHSSACLATMGNVPEYEGDGGCPGFSSAVQAAVDFFGPIDFTNPAVWFSPTTLFGAQTPDVYKSASPLTYVKAGDPPIFIAHGDSDRIVHLANSVEFDAALTAAGVPHQFLIVKNADHGFRPMPGLTISPSYHEIQVTARAFLDKYLKTP